MRDVTLVSGPVDHHTAPFSRTRTGCLTCRRRKKKCDENHPLCTGCERNKLECQWESNSSLGMPRRRRRRPRISEKTLPGQAQGMVNTFIVLKPDIVSRLLNHFLRASPRWLSTRTGSERTNYLEWLFPAIADSPLVLNCILTIASADLLKYERGDLELQHVAVEYYGQSVSSLRTAIETEMTETVTPDAPLSDYNPLAVLLLCLHETQNFTETERILPHLNAAITLLQSRMCSGSMNTALRGFIFELFCYFFSLSAYSLGPKLSLRRAYRIFNSPSVIDYIQPGHIMGTSQYLFFTIFRVSTLAQTLASGKDDQTSRATTELLSLDRNLAVCQVECANKGDMDIGCLSDAVTSELYRLACRIYIRKVVDPSTPDSDEGLQSLLVDFIYQLECLPLNSPSNSILSWPLVVAGLCATVKIHQRIIVTKLVQIHQEWQSDIFSKSAAFLREKWKENRKQKCSEPSTTPQNADKSDTLHSGEMIWYKLPVILA